jgi:hypothetical protein
LVKPRKVNAKIEIVRAAPGMTPMNMSLPDGTRISVIQRMPKEGISA